MERSKKLALAFIMIIAMLSSYIVPSAMNKGHYINGVLLVNKKYGLPKELKCTLCQGQFKKRYF